MRLDALSANCEIFFTILDSKRDYSFIVMPIYSCAFRGANKGGMEWVDETKIGRLVKRDFLFLDELIFESVEHSNRFFSLSINFHIPFILLACGTKPIVFGL